MVREQLPAGLVDLLARQPHLAAVEVVVVGDGAALVLPAIGQLEVADLQQGRVILRAEDALDDVDRLAVLATEGHRLDADVRAIGALGRAEVVHRFRLQRLAERVEADRVHEHRVEVLLEVMPEGDGARDDLVGIPAQREVVPDAGQEQAVLAAVDAVEVLAGGDAARAELEEAGGLGLEVPLHVEVIAIQPRRLDRVDRDGAVDGVDLGDDGRACAVGADGRGVARGHQRLVDLKKLRLLAVVEHEGGRARAALDAAKGAVLLAVQLIGARADEGRLARVHLALHDVFELGQVAADGQDRLVGDRPVRVVVEIGILKFLPGAARAVVDGLLVAGAAALLARDLHADAMLGACEWHLLGRGHLGQIPEDLVDDDVPRINLVDDPREGGVACRRSHVTWLPSSCCVRTAPTARLRSSARGAWAAAPWWCWRC